MRALSLAHPPGGRSRRYVPDGAVLAVRGHHRRRGERLNAAVVVLSTPLVVVSERDVRDEREAVEAARTNG